MRNLTCIVSILLLIILGGTSPSCGEQKSVKQLTKIINCDGVLYMSNERNSTVTLVAVNVKEKEDVGREFLLPATTASSYGKYLFCWDIFNKHIFFISVSEFAPKQRIFKLVKIPLANLKLVKSEQEPKEDVPALKDVVTKIKPLTGAFVMAEIKETGTVFFDLMVIGENVFELYILSNKQITVWKYDSSNWQEQYTVKADFEGPFNVISQNNKTYLFNKESNIYSISKSELQKVGRITEQSEDDKEKQISRVFIVDKDAKEVLFFTSLKLLVDPSNLLNIRTIKKEDPNFINFEHSVNNALKFLR